MQNMSVEAELIAKRSNRGGGYGLKKTVCCHSYGHDRGVVISERGQGAMAPPTSIFEPNKVQEFQFQTSGILLFMGV